MGSIGDIALEKALPFDGANSGTASSSADADSVSILTTIDAVVYDWDIATDRLTWRSNVETTLAGFARSALATGAGFAARITCDSESSRLVHNGSARDEGQGVPFRVSYRMASSQGALYEVEDFGRWFADGAGRPCRVHGVMRVLSRAPIRRPSSPKSADARIGSEPKHPCVVALAERGRRVGFRASTS